MTIVVSSSTQCPDLTPLRLSVERLDHDHLVIRVAGDVDAVGTPRLRELLEAKLRGVTRAVVLDLSAVTFLSSAGLSELDRAHLLAAELGVRFTVHVGEARQVRRVIELFPLAVFSAVDG
ncbi:STAS domain-containing protein [Amycolatopsis sp. PS_44_ISF1]|uniref:STAS domain-containing protein n=1 Tax=Amycolatopsis sp. PS_44_ISF1 TaxID=2974917 RepID=UPI0028E00508|nr:STAS domain-containing protein [Amycolatopsis sp. PS_44_ISF1]MDT8914944.1 STAS domain-containing protein [Amycolatopsis sp. PS_44_ISF1]